jgi:catechol 2,3-dioxygenase-like lactoylglutathione lyase family enzyme
MFDHVTIRVSDRSVSEPLFETVLSRLGAEATYRTNALTAWRDFLITEASDEHPVTTRLHLAFVSPSREQVDAFWQAGVDAGLRDDGPPGPRPQYREDYYGAYLRDPDDNSIEAVHHGALRRGDGIIQHLWLRVAAFPAARDFYRLIGDAAGYDVGYDAPERITFAGREPGGSFTLVPGPPTANLHMAFPGTDETVQRFHAEAVAAGYRDNGGPGERPRYHPGYYAAYVLDPDGNNIEVVDHHLP